MKNVERVDAIREKAAAEYQQVVFRGQSAKKGRRIQVTLVFGIASLLFSSCSPAVVATSTPMYTETPMTTATSKPTETATPTPEAGIDMEKFHNLPKIYEYLLAHPDEFVQAPDPLTERAAFDRWWNEEFLAALGEPIERDVDIRVGAMHPGREGGYEAWVGPSQWHRDGTLISQPGFFYFETNGEVFPVPVIDVATTDGPYVDFTMAVILFDYDIPYDMSTGTSLSLLQEENYLLSIQIVGGNPPGDYSEAVREFNRNDRIIVDWLNRVVFGFGYIKPINN